METERLRHCEEGEVGLLFIRSDGWIYMSEEEALRLYPDFMHRFTPEGTAEWLAAGFESQRRVKAGGSTPLPSSISTGHPTSRDSK